MSKRKIERIDPEIFQLPLVGADSHAHLTSSSLIDSLSSILEKATHCGVASIGNVFLGPQEYECYKNIFREYTQVFFILGIHPCDALHCNNKILDAIYKIVLLDKRVKAIGEIGLDFYWKDCPFSIQEEVFRKQLSLAKECNLPVVIHSRDAASETIRILEAEGCIGYPVLWHCFSGDAVALLDRVISNAWSLSVAGPISYSANKDLHDAISQMPLKYLLLETDCPYLAPNPWRGKQNEPALIVFTAKAVADLKKLPIQDIWKQCGDNTRLFFNII